MTREEVKDTCIKSIGKSDFLLLELPTGFGKSKLSIDLVSYLAVTKYKGEQVSMLLLVAKKVHKTTWKAEFDKWGGINVNTLTIECYESLKNYENSHFDIIVMDEVHHIGSDLRLDILSTIDYGNIIGLSATIPRKLKSCLQTEYHAKVVSCNVVKAIEDNVLPEPKIVLFPLQLDRVYPTEILEINPKAKGKVYQGTYKELWKYKRRNLHALISCTQRQRVNEYNGDILRKKNLFLKTRQQFLKTQWLKIQWLMECDKRIKYLANLKNDIVLSILKMLKNSRTITFCKTIEQAEELCEYCIHSKNKDSDIIYKQFNDKKINHIASVNILNENANLVDCKYAIFANYSSSETIGPQRIGRSLRHKSPVIIMPYYENTREQEIMEDMIKDFSKDCIYTIHSVDELVKFM